MILPFVILLHSIFVGILILFQLCLAAGLPWGAASMGGKFPGVYPRTMRFVAVINAMVLFTLSCIVLIEAGVFFIEYRFISSIGIWLVVCYYFLGTILNSITPSKIERIWAPIAAILFFTSLSMALQNY